MLTTSHLLAGVLVLGLSPMPPEPMPDPLARGYLGIVVEQGTLMIKDVEPSTPAARVGLQSGDTITRVGQLQPQAFEEVVTQICNYRPGTLLEVEVRRGSDSMVFRVRLAARPDRLGPPPGIFQDVPAELK